MAAALLDRLAPNRFAHAPLRLLPGGGLGNLEEAGRIGDHQSVHLGASPSRCTKQGYHMVERMCVSPAPVGQETGLDPADVLGDEDLVEMAPLGQRYQACHDVELPRPISEWSNPIRLVVSSALRMVQQIS